MPMLATLAQAGSAVHRAKMFHKSALAAAFGWAALAAHAQAPGELPKPWTYDGSMRLQQQYDQQQQQLRDQRQQQQQQQDRLYNDAQSNAIAHQNAANAQARAVFTTWQKRPPLAPDRNPLLGRWISQGPSAAATQKLSGANPMAKLLGPDFARMTSELVGGMTAGLCDSMLGRGTIEFRPDALLAIGHDGSQRIKYRVEYRGGGTRVVMLPHAGASFTHMIVDFDSRDHATVAGAGCVLVRAEFAESGASKVTARRPVRTGAGHSP